MTEPFYVVCHNGVFVLPDAIYKSLASLARKDFVYLREDEDALLISTTPITDGRRRVLHTRFRSQMLRHARQLAIVDLKESIRVMPVT
ncbi:MAG TPA: hypothetical protein VKB93_28650 [Thermoanaerobaculia bacterium]|nr:hypothetical protein [Thermoanaerobaculia bacterium]